MDVVGLGIILGGAIVIGFILWAACNDGYIVSSNNFLGRHWVPIFVFPLVLMGFLWMLCSGYSKEIIESTSTYDIHQIDDVQAITYMDACNHPKMLNVNKHFGRTFESDKKIEVTITSKGPYLGLLWPKKTRFEIEEN